MIAPKKPIAAPAAAAPAALPPRPRPRPRPPRPRERTLWTSDEPEEFLGQALVEAAKLRGGGWHRQPQERGAEHDEAVDSLNFIACSSRARKSRPVLRVTSSRELWSDFHTSNVASNVGLPATMRSVLIGARSPQTGNRRSVASAFSFQFQRITDHPVSTPEAHFMNSTESGRDSRSRCRCADYSCGSAVCTILPYGCAARRRRR